MESQLSEPQAATDVQAATNDRDYYTGNRRTLEFLILAGVLALGMPIAILIGVSHGEKRASVVYSETPAAPSRTAAPGTGL